jgi:hypothetical protein
VLLIVTPGSGFSSPWATVFTDLPVTRRLIFSDQGDQAQRFFASTTIPQMTLARNVTRAATLPARAGAPASPGMFRIIPDAPGAAPTAQTVLKMSIAWPGPTENNFSPAWTI